MSKNVRSTTQRRILNPILVGALLCGAAAGYGASIPNPSFEADTYTMWPGYISGNGEITGWTANNPDRVGLNPAESSPFADNGAIPDGSNVAFIQSDPEGLLFTSLSTTISGLEVGTVYKVSFRENARNPQPDNGYPNLRVSIDSQELLALTVYSAGGTKPYWTVGFEFTAEAPEQTLTLVNDATGDTTVLVDDFKITTGGNWSVTQWNNDSDSGVDSQFFYTHAYNFNNAANAVINGITFKGVAGGNPSVAGQFTTTFLANTFLNDGNSVTDDGGSRMLANDFVYGGTVGAGDYQSITMSGLTPGIEYIFTLYSVGFDAPGLTIRWASFGMGDDWLTVNQDQFGNDAGILISYRYTADASGTAIFRYSPINPSNVSIHTYGFSNREATSRNVPPVITAQPKDLIIAQGTPAIFAVTANALPDPTYQWRVNGQNISGATEATYTSAPVLDADAGNYDVVIANVAGSITSRVARLTVGLPMNNASFEADVFSAYPGYVSGNFPITGWNALGGHGINPGVDWPEGNNPFTDNGTIPHGKQVAFLQADGALSQVVSGFTVGGQYYLHYYENARTVSVVPALEVKVGGKTLIPTHQVPAVGGSNPYNEIYTDLFVADATELEVSFIKANPNNGDGTMLIDNVAVVKIQPNTTPFITKNPQGKTVQVGDTYTFSLQVLGSLPFNYQWLKNGTPITDATAATLTLNNIQKPAEGDYSVRISNGGGAITSVVARLSVDEPVPGLFNTGVDDTRVPLADNSVDQHYILVENPDVPDSDDAIVEDGTVFPISDGTWIRNNTSSKWIGPRFNTSQSAVGFYTYRVPIDLTGRDLKKVAIEGQWSTDNNGRDIRVNGVSTGNPENGGFNTWTKFTIYGTNVNFVAGSNAIDFIVENVQDVGYTGLRVELTKNNAPVPAGVAPTITLQPTGGTGVVSDSFSFSAAASGTSPLSYQWKKNGQALSGQTLPTLTLTNLIPGDSGDYTVEVTNGAGSATSQAANLCVCLQPIPGIFGTGVGTDGKLLTDGQVDPHYILTASSSAENQGPDAIVVNSAFPIAPNGPWVANGPRSKWISATANQVTGIEEGSYTFQTSFDLTGYDLSKVTMSGAYSVDNTLVDIIVNGLSTAITGAGFDTWHPFTLTVDHGLQAGPNTIEFIWSNAASTPNPAALRVDMRGLLSIPPPVQGPRLTITLNGANVSVAWTPAEAGQKLQSASDIKGPWTDVINPANPYTAPISGAPKFFRIAQ